jgi:hypothetical protein
MSVRDTMIRLRIAIASIAIACGLLHPSPARAQTLPSGASIRIGRTLDAAAFARAVETRFRIELRNVVAADVDRDGDLDVLASTDRELLVWVNDGAGRLTQRPPTEHKPAITGDAPGDTWRTDDGADHDTIQNDAPSLRFVAGGWHTPPRRVSTAASPRVHARAFCVSLGTLVPRAPPPTPAI